MSEKAKLSLVGGVGNLFDRFVIKTQQPYHPWILQFFLRCFYVKRLVPLLHEYHLAQLIRHRLAVNRITENLRLRTVKSLPRIVGHR